MTEGDRVRHASISVQPLSIFQRIIYAIAGYGVGSATAVVEGPLIFYYSDELGVSTQYLAVVNFIVGVTTIFASLLIGGISDRSKARYRRKPFIAVLMFVYSAGLFFRFGAFTSSEAAPFYYAVTMFCQMCGNVTLGVVQGAWAVELANEGADRANFFAVCGVVGVFGIFFGLGLSAAPLVFTGVLLSFIAILTNSLCLWCIEERTPLSKRSFIPTVTNLKSVLWNKQFVIFISAMVCIYFINTIPTLYLFFLTYVMKQGEDAANLTYMLSVAGFVIMGFFAMPMAPRLISKYGKIAVADFTLKGMVVLGTLMFVASFVHVGMVVAVFSIVGFLAALSGTVFSIMQADIIDYDELLTGMKRGASYGGISGPANTFVTIAGTSLPLALMSVFNFEAPDPDADDLSDDRAQDGYSSDGSTGVLRVYCTLFIALCSFLSMLILKQYKIDNSVHDDILASIHRRNISDSASESPDPLCDEFDAPARISTSTSTARESLVEDEMPIIKADTNLASVPNPVTGGNVLPAPYITVQQTISLVLESKTTLAAHLPSLDEVQCNELRLLGYYFPARMNLLLRDDDIQTILMNGYIRFVVFFGVMGVGVWQCVQALVQEKEFPTYLVVVFTTLYIFLFVWEVLYAKGYRLLRRMLTNKQSPLQSYLEVIHAQLDLLEPNKTCTTGAAAGTGAGVKNGDQIGETLLSEGADEDRLYSTPSRDVTVTSAKTIVGVLVSLTLAVLVTQLS